MAHSATHLVYHVIFSTKHRQALLTDEIRPRVCAYMGGICQRLGVTLLEIGGVADHIHLLLRLRPDVTLADVVRTIKANSSKWIRAELRQQDFGWQAGYSGFTVSESVVSRLKIYIQRQEEHHRQVTFKEELEKVLQRHGLEWRNFDESLD